MGLVRIVGLFLKFMMSQPQGVIQAVLRSVTAFGRRKFDTQILINEGKNNSKAWKIGFVNLKQCQEFDSFFKTSILFISLLIMTTHLIH